MYSEERSLLVERVLSGICDAKHFSKSWHTQKRRIDFAYWCNITEQQPCLCLMNTLGCSSVSCFEEKSNAGHTGTTTPINDSHNTLVLSATHFCVNRSGIMLIRGWTRRRPDTSVGGPSVSAAVHPLWDLSQSVECGDKLLHVCHFQDDGWCRGHPCAEMNRWIKVISFPTKV